MNETDSGIGSPPAEDTAVRAAFRQGRANGRQCVLLKPIPLTLTASVLVVVVCTAYHRIGTTANVSRIEHSRNLGGGFVSVGMTETAPGFVLLSALDQSALGLAATEAANWVTGAHSYLELKTDQGFARIRLRGPLAVVVLKDGSISTETVEWSVDDFNAILRSMDCESPNATRCGAPFADLAELWSSWSPKRQARLATDFLSRYAGPHGR